MNSIESKANSELYATWAARANAGHIALNTVIVLAIIPICFISVLSIQSLISDVALPVGPSAAIVAGFVVIYAISIRMIGRRTVYVGSQRGICSCYCNILSDDHIAVKYTSSFIIYSKIKKVKLLKIFGRYVIVFEQYPDAEGVRLSAEGVRFRYVRQYRNLTLTLNSTGIWTGSCKPADSAEARLVSGFIKNTPKTNIGVFKFIYSSIWVSGGIFCDEQAAKFVIARILRSDGHRYGQ